MPNLLAWQAATDWKTSPISLPANIEGFEMIAGPAPDPSWTGSPMVAYLGPSGERRIWYDGVLCQQMGSYASMFVLLHEIAHHTLLHTAQPIVPTLLLSAAQQSMGREAQADNVACREAVRFFPLEAPEVLDAIYKYWAAAQGSGGSSHPSDAQRAVNVYQQWQSYLSTARCDILVHNDPLTPRDAIVKLLGVLQVNPVLVDPLIHQAELTGSLRLNYDGNGYFYGQVVAFIREVIMDARKHGYPLMIDFAMR